MDILKFASKSSTGQISWPEASSIKQCCKYFFEKNSIIVVEQIYNDGRKLCPKHCIKCMNFNYWSPIEINRIRSKIWLTGGFYFREDVILSSAFVILSKLYRCEDALLNISFTKMILEEFILFASKFQKFYLSYSTIMDNKGTVVMLDQILESIPNVRELEFKDISYVVTASTIKNITKLKKTLTFNLGNLQKLTFLKIPGIIGINDVLELIKALKDTKILLEFSYMYGLFDAYVEQLDQLIDDVIDSKLCNCVIYYSGQNERKHYIMESRFHGQSNV